MNLPDHIPSHKQAELHTIMDIIEPYIPKRGIHKIILYGSYARGDFVEEDSRKENGYTITYASDFDIIVIVKTQNYNKQV